MTRLQSYLVFFSVLFVVYGGANAYVFVRLLQGLPRPGAARPVFAVLFWILALSYIAARFLERAVPGQAADALVWTGSFWMAALVYLLLAFLAMDLFRLADRLLHFFPAFLSDDPARTKRLAAIAAATIAAAAVAIGAVNAALPRTVELELAVHKKSPLKSLRVVMASDLHMGTVIAEARVSRVVERINALNPEIVLFAGDLVDEDLAPVVRRDLGNALTKIKAKYGVYGVTGNHEYIGGADAAVDYLRRHGVDMLRDQAVVVDGAFIVAGREDRSADRRIPGGRKGYDALLAGLDRSLPIIAMDHQPAHLEEAETAGIDLQLSGHTHNGQLWPFDFITRSVYEKSWGYLRKGDSQFYVSCGVGTWGPPVRTNARPEVVLLKLTFD